MTLRQQLDAVRRLEQGSSDPALERNAQGQPIRIFNEFLNLNSRVVRGVDVSVSYDFDTSFGDFHTVLDVSRLTDFDQTPSSESSELLAAGLPAAQVRPGQTIELSERARNFISVREGIELSVDPPAYLYRNVSEFQGTLSRPPERSEIPLPVEVDERLIVEFYS